MRLFVALFPPPDVIACLTDAVLTVAGGLPRGSVAWTAPEQVHLTLNFLDAVAAGSIGELETVLEGVCRTAQAHRLRARGLGCFPGTNRPRILWAGLDGPPPALASLKGTLDNSLTPLGYRPEERAFHPHLTLGRVKELRAGDRPPLARALRELREADFGQWTARRVDLMRSVLTPGGACYSIVRSFALAGH